jgi:hypothetical protein
MPRSGVPGPEGERTAGPGVRGGACHPGQTAVVEADGSRYLARLQDLEVESGELSWGRVSGSRRGLAARAPGAGPRSSGTGEGRPQGVIVRNLAKRDEPERPTPMARRRRRRSRSDGLLTLIAAGALVAGSSSCPGPASIPRYSLIVLSLIGLSVIRWWRTVTGCTRLPPDAA